MAITSQANLRHGSEVSAWTHITMPFTVEGFPSEFSFDTLPRDLSKFVFKTFHLFHLHSCYFFGFFLPFTSFFARPDLLSVENLPGASRSSSLLCSSLCLEFSHIIASAAAEILRIYYLVFTIFQSPRGDVLSLAPHRKLLTIWSTRRLKVGISGRLRVIKLTSQDKSHQKSSKPDRVPHAIE